MDDLEGGGVKMAMGNLSAENAAPNSSPLG
jgi:hypothetical protein